MSVETRKENDKKAAGMLTHGSQVQLKESLLRTHIRKPVAGKEGTAGRKEEVEEVLIDRNKRARPQRSRTHISSWDLPLSRSVTGGLEPPGGIVGGETDAAAKGDGEVQGEERPPWLLSADDMWRRSRPDNAAVLPPPSEGAKGSLGVT